MTATAHVSYKPTSRALDESYLLETILGLMDEYPIRRVCDIGGGRNPLVPKEIVEERGLHYTLLDIAEEELDLAPAGYHKLLGDVCDPSLTPEAPFDLVFSRMVMEHVSDGGQAHRNIFRMLAPGGIAVHLFPTLYALPFVANRVLPERIASVVLDLFNPRDRKRQGKFPAYYSWCRGPTPAQIERLEKIGYEIVDYRGLFGHDFYFRTVPPLAAISRRLSRFLMEKRLSALSSYALVILRRPQ
jgi:2-polyprenyl-3-methyl-5-hydroxy-6-metoxy-1,4-benzoquinol methylase